jgi:dolichyl-phosphate-mannose-protein mannosyltransferase
MILLCGFIVAMRATGPLFGLLDLDEGDMVVIGRLFADGGLPYLDFLEKKPVLLYVFALVGSPRGFSAVPMQLLAIAWTCATAWALERTVRASGGARDTARAAAWLYALTTAGNPAAPGSELLANLPVAFALWAYARARRDDRLAFDGLAGGLVGVATLFRHQAGTVLLAMLALHLAAALRERRRAWRSVSATAFGFALPWGAAGAIYGALGHWAAFYEWNVERNLHYAAGWPATAAARAGWALGLYVVLGAPLAWWFGVVRRPASPDPTSRLVRAGLWLGLVPVCLGGRFYGHYFIQLAPFLALAAASGAADVWRSRRALGRPARAVLAAALIVPLLVHRGREVRDFAAGRLPLQHAGARAVAEWIRGNTRPEARIALWGTFTPLYLLAERLPGTRYKTPAPLFGDFDTLLLPAGFSPARYASARDVEAWLDDLRIRRPELVVDTSPADLYGYGRTPIESFAPLWDHIRRHYERAAVVAGMPIYQLKTSGLPAR